jgi:hypothetical protein
MTAQSAKLIGNASNTPWAPYRCQLRVFGTLRTDADAKPAMCDAIFPLHYAFMALERQMVNAATVCNNLKAK